MNVVIPIGGIGSRFQKEGYRFSKPLVNIVGRPMLLWVLDNLNFDFENDTLWIAYNNFMEQDLSKLISKEFPKLRVKCVILHAQTRGAAETLFSVTQHFSLDDLHKRTISLDCDAIYFHDILSEFRKLPDGRGCCFYFKDYGDKAIYSYIELNDEQLISRVKEKVKISDNANTGAYGFPSGQLLKNYCMYVIDKGVVGGEYYTSNIISSMLADFAPFHGLEVPKDCYFCVGTPDQLQDFLFTVKQKTNKNIKIKSPMRFCFDLDNTLVTFPSVNGDYSTCEPRTDNINLVKDLYEAGHVIIIQTARRVKTHGGNVGAILADIGKLTFNQLEEFNIPYHEIYFGKPYAHVYVDDLAVNALIDTAKEIGWSNTVCNSVKKHKEMVDHRSFNEIVRMGDVIVKTTDMAVGEGEAYFYENIPYLLSDLFPKLIGIDKLPNKKISITMSYVKSTSFAQLNSIGCITPGRLKKLLKTLSLIHQHGSGGVKTHLYTPKLEERFENNQQVYLELDPNVAQTLECLHSKLNEYETSDRQLLATYIHGDPVFSNVLLTPDGYIKLIDMRGHRDGELTLSGDLVYDLAKVYQSLLGYDIVLLLGREPNSQEMNMLSDLRNIFEESVTHDADLIDIQLITMSHLFTLIPLHKSKCIRKWAYSIVSQYITQ